MSDYSVLIGGMRDLLGDLAADEWDAGVLDRSLRMALGRYGQVFERVECSLTQLANGGLHNLELTFSGLTIPREVAYLHWPAASSIAATTAENRLLDWWVWYASTAAAPSVFKPRFGFQVSGAELPAANDYVLYYGILDHQIDGMTPEEYGTGTAAVGSTVPRTHFHLLQAGGAAYALRSRESGLSVQADVEPGFVDAYHVGVLADLSDRCMQEFEAGLELLKQKRLERPPWGMPERKRLRRLESAK
jgi:hypothetical protein